MKRRILLTIAMVLFISLSVFASPSFYLKGAYLWSYDTNVFSNPMVKNAEDWWFNNKSDEKTDYLWYLKRMNNGLHLDGDIFFSEGSRTGLSFSADFGFPYRAKNYIPEKNGSNWSDFEYVEKDAASPKTSMFFSLGPVFRAELGCVDLGAALRVSVGSYKFFNNELIFGIQFEPYLNIFFMENMFVSLGLMYDAHLMMFLPKEKERFYADNYMMLTSGAYVGLGVKLGGERSKRNI